MDNTKLSEIWDQRAEQHASRKGCRTEDPGSRLYEISWWRHIEPLLSEITGGRILEAGCGVGRWVERLAPMGFEMTLTDISPAMLKKAEEAANAKGYRGKVSFEVADIGAMDALEDNSFHMAIATGEPVSMCDTPQKAIGELCRVVRPGGYVLCDAGNRYRRAYDMFRDNPSEPLLPLLETGKSSHGELTLHLLGPDEMSAIFNDLNMELLTLAGITPMFTFPPNQGQKKALADSRIVQDQADIDKKFHATNGMLYLSSRLIAVARKPA